MGVTRHEWRLIRKQGNDIRVWVRGSEEYVRAEFTDAAAHTMPAHVAARLGKEPVFWVIEYVEVTETLLSSHHMSEAEVEAARDEAARAGGVRAGRYAVNNSVLGREGNNSLDATPQEIAAGLYDDSVPLHEYLRRLRPGS